MKLRKEETRRAVIRGQEGSGEAGWEGEGLVKGAVGRGASAGHLCTTTGNSNALCVSASVKAGNKYVKWHTHHQPV